MEHALLTGLGLAAPAGLNAYIPLLVLALAARFSDRVTLTPPFDVLTSTPALVVLVVLLTIEVLVDKVPGFDHANDLVQTIVRPAAGAVLALATAGVATLDPWLAGILGLAVAGSVHAAKATVRPVVTIGSGGIFNPLVSLGEDVLAGTAAVAAVFVPLLAIVFLVAFAFFVVVALRQTRRLGRRLARPLATESRR